MNILNPCPIENVKSVLEKTGIEIEIRQLVPGDEIHLRNFFLNLSEEAIRSFYNFHKDKRVLTEERNLKLECSLNPRTHLRLVAVHDGEIVGIGTLYFSLFQEEPGQVGHLISDDYQRKGIGTILMEMMLSYARNHQVGDYISAQTAVSNIGSRKLLEKFGFVIKSAGDGEIHWEYRVR